MTGLLWLAVACSSTPSVPDVTSSAVEASAPATLGSAVAVGGYVVFPALLAGGQIVSATGVAPVAGDPCGPGGTGTVMRASLPAIDRPVLAIRGGQTFSFPKPPAVEAATVERIARKMAEFLGPPEGIIPGGSGERDPARDRGVTVRSVRKTRTNGPPVLVAVGYRDNDLAVLVADPEGEGLLASVRVEWPEESGEPRVLPVSDFDGDGAQELVVYGDGARPIRRVFRVALDGAKRVEAFAPLPIPACAVD